MKKYYHTLLTFLAAISFHTLSAQCVVTLQPGPNDGKDASTHGLPCSSSFAVQGGSCDTTNQGNGSYLYTMAWTWQSTPGKRRTLIEFDLDSLANAGCMVTEAKLVMFNGGDNPNIYHCGQNTQTHPCNSNEFKIHRITQQWDENTVTAANQPTYASTAQGIDYVDVPNEDDEYDTYVMDITDMVNYWLSNPATNHGMVLKFDNESNYYKAVRFASSDNVNPSLRPKLVLTTQCANTCDNVISGYIYDDVNADCNLNGTDARLENWLVEIQPGPIYATSDVSGYYEAYVGSGNYTVTQHYPNTYLWDSLCPLPYEHSVTATGGSLINADFAVEADMYCPVLTVDIGSAFLRKCHNENFVVSYCNDGNLTANGVYIDVDFSPGLTPLSATLPYSTNNGILTFNIGTVLPGECGTFHVTTLVDCNATFGDIECVEAIILPEFLCDEPVDTAGWDKSSVMVTGNCIGDSLACFTIFNTGDAGNGNMQGTSEFRIYENNVLVYTGTFQIDGQTDTVICWPTNGNSIRLEADQRPGHPGNSNPNDVVENCGTNYTAFNFVNELPNDDAEQNVALECEEIVSSYDPNDKKSVPSGVGPNNYIAANTMLDYKIRFQNTGNDTAFTVVIRDTLTEYLDLNTVVTGASSHPYTFRIYGDRILEFTFANILLPDSNVNEPLSNGFVKFKVNQVPNNPIGTDIDNSCAIFFDFNDPVITNTSHVEIADMTAVLALDDAYYDNLSINVYPNPFAESTTIEVEGYLGQSLQLEMYDLMGKHVRSEQSGSNIIQLQKRDLAPGIYVYKLYDNNGQVGAGKLIIK